MGDEPGSARVVGSGGVGPRRLLVAIPSLVRGGDSKMQGGPEGVILNLLNAFDRERFEVHLAVDDVATSDLIELVDAPLHAHSPPPVPGTGSRRAATRPSGSPAWRAGSSPTSCSRRSG